MKMKFLFLLVFLSVADVYASEGFLETLVLAPLRLGQGAIECVVELGCALFDPCPMKVVEKRVIFQPVAIDGNPIPVSAGEITTGYRRVIADRHGNQRIYCHDDHGVRRHAPQFEYYGPIHY